MATFYFMNKFIKEDNTEVDFKMSSDDMSNPLIFKEKIKGKKTEPFLLVPNYLGKETSALRFQFWYEQTNPSFKVYPGQRYLTNSFPRNKEYVFLPCIKNIEKSVQCILGVEDDCKSNIMYDDESVFMKNYNTIQLDKKYLSSHIGKHLHVLVKLNPQLIEITDEVKSATSENKQRIPGYVEGARQDKVVNVNNASKSLELKIIKDDEVINVNSLDNTRSNKEILDEFLEQEIDLPIQLMELLMLGISCKARSANVLQVDPRAGTPYMINPYLERYELAIKKAIDNQFINQSGIEKRTVYTKGFF